MLTLKGSTAVVTGAASGIGRALSVALAAQGLRLVLADVDADGLSKVSGELGATAVPTDVADPAAVEALAASAPDVRLVCLNAGIVGADTGAPWEVSPADWDRVFAINVGGVVNGLRAFVPRLLEAGEPAHILVTASLAGILTFPAGGAYAASKHAVVSVVEHAAMALADTPIGVSMICPALVATAMSDIGEDPADVATEALATLTNGTFAVIPPEWRDATLTRATTLATGTRPTPPVPSA